jgi:predicted RNA-binding Zn-ribbon protein involved in translation (DUF1610 family)
VDAVKDPTPKCPRCGAAMRALFTSIECPNACPPGAAARTCPKCGSRRVARFPWTQLVEDPHNCADCGAVFSGK